MRRRKAVKAISTILGIVLILNSTISLAGYASELNDVSKNKVITEDTEGKSDSDINKEEPTEAKIEGKSPELPVDITINGNEEASEELLKSAAAPENENGANPEKSLRKL